MAGVGVRSSVDLLVTVATIDGDDDRGRRTLVDQCCSGADLRIGSLVYNEDSKLNYESMSITFKDDNKARGY